jgi:hypothetical protein
VVGLCASTGCSSYHDNPAQWKNETEDLSSLHKP